MANSVGQLVAKLGLDAAEFTAGLSKSEYQARKFSNDVSSSFKAIGATIAGLGLGAAFLSATKDIISSASALNDLADTTGASVEDLSRLSNQAKIAGADFATLQNALIKLSAGMAGTDEETTKAKEALKILGITTRDPAQALQEIAVKLATYADGVNKVGFAVALFGKQGGQFLATLADIAKLQDVAATTNAKQAEEAEKLEQSYRRLSVESRAFANVLLNDVVPALNDTIGAFNKARASGGGFGEVVRTFLASGAIGFESASESVERITANVERLKKSIEDSKASSFDKFFGIGTGNLERNLATEQKALAIAIARRDAEIAVSNAKNADRQTGKPEAPNPPAAAGNVRSIKDQATDAERLIESLKKQVIGQQDLTAADQAELDIVKLMHEANSGLTDDRIAQIRLLAAQVTATNEAKKAEQERLKAEEEARRQAKQNADELARNIDANRKHADAILESNRRIQEQIAFLYGGEKALKALRVAEQDAAIAAAERVVEMHKEASAQSEADEKMIRSQQDIVDALKAVKKSGEDLDLAEQFAKEAKAAEDLANTMVDAFSNAFEGFILGTKSAKDAFRDFAKDVESYLVKLALHKVGDAIFGGTTAQGPDFFTMLAKLASGFLGGGAGGGSGLGYGTIGSAIPPGPFPYASGTDFVPSNQLAFLHQGEAVLTAKENRERGSGRSINNVYHINVMPGATTQSARQAGKQLSAAVMSSLRNP